MTAQATLTIFSYWLIYRFYVIHKNAQTKCNVMVKVKPPVVIKFRPRQNVFISIFVLMVFIPLVSLEISLLCGSILARIALEARLFPLWFVCGSWQCPVVTAAAGRAMLWQLVLAETPRRRAGELAAVARIPGRKWIKILYRWKRCRLTRVYSKFDRDRDCPKMLIFNWFKSDLSLVHLHLSLYLVNIFGDEK